MSKKEIKEIVQSMISPAVGASFAGVLIWTSTTSINVTCTAMLAGFLAGTAANIVLLSKNPLTRPHS